MESEKKSANFGDGVVEEATGSPEILSDEGSEMMDKIGELTPSPTRRTKKGQLGSN